MNANVNKAKYIMIGVRINSEKTEITIATYRLTIITYILQFINDSELRIINTYDFGNWYYTAIETMNL